MVESNKLKEADYIISVPRKKGFVSEFFNHMIAYGGFSFEDGVMRVWGDTSLFTPVKGLVIYYNEIKKTIGKKDTNDIFYWLGRLYGKNSSIMLIKKFGFDKRKLPDFINGATQDGFGYIEIKNLHYQNNIFRAEVTGINSTFSAAYKDLFGKQKDPIDHYMCGILSGGAEPLFNDLPLKCFEKECMVKGDDHCGYYLENLEKNTSPTFFRKLPFKESDIIKKSGTMALKRNIKFKFFQVKDIKFGDGKFILNNYQGFNMAAYEHIILDKIVIALLGKDRFIKIKNQLSKIYIDETFNDTLKSKIISKDKLQKVLGKIKLFGFGSLALISFVKNIVIIKNTDNPYTADLKELFGKVDDTSIYLLSKLLEYSFKRYFGKDVKLSILKNDFKEAIFKINF